MRFVAAMQKIPTTQCFSHKIFGINIVIISIIIIIMTSDLHQTASLEELKMFSGSRSFGKTLTTEQVHELKPCFPLCLFLQFPVHSLASLPIRRCNTTDSPDFFSWTRRDALSCNHQRQHVLAFPSTNKDDTADTKASW